MPINLMRLQAAIDNNNETEVQNIIEECKRNNESLKVFLYYGKKKVSLLSYAIDKCWSDESSQNILLLLVTAVDARNRSMIHLNVEDDTLMSPFSHLVHNEWMPEDFKQLMLELIKDKILQEVKQDNIEKEIKFQLVQAIFALNMDKIKAAIADMVLNNISFDFKVGTLPLMNFVIGLSDDNEVCEELINLLLKIPSVNINRRCQQNSSLIEHLLLTDGMSLEMKERIFQKMLGLKDYNNVPKLKADIGILRSAVACNYPSFVRGLLTLRNPDGKEMIEVNTISGGKTILDYALSFGKGLDESIVHSLKAAGAKKFIELNAERRAITNNTATSSSSHTVSTTAQIAKIIPQKSNSDFIELYRFKINDPIIKAMVPVVNQGCLPTRKTQQLWLILKRKLRRPVNIAKYQFFNEDLAELDKIKTILQKFDNMIIKLPHQSMDAIFVDLFLKVILGGLEINDDELGIEDFQRLDILINHYHTLLDRDFTTQQADDIYDMFKATIKTVNKKNLTSVDLFELLDESFKIAIKMFEAEPRRLSLAAK